MASVVGSHCNREKAVLDYGANAMPDFCHIRRIIEMYGDVRQGQEGNLFLPVPGLSDRAPDIYTLHAASRTGKWSKHITSRYIKTTRSHKKLRACTFGCMQLLLCHSCSKMTKTVLIKVGITVRVLINIPTNDGLVNLTIFPMELHH